MKCELLAPAGNLGKLKLALSYGADAVYAGGKNFSLRAYAGNLSEEELAEGISYAHARGKKVYVAANIFARNADFGDMGSYFCELQEMKADAVLISDPGVLRLCRRVAPALPVHISTQANVLNAEAVKFWAEAGASRVVLARELSVGEIAAIHAAVPETELEAFVHGAMCISYSGRCYLSDYLTGRSSNRGECSQPCREPYFLRTAAGDLTAEEDGRGAYLLNSRDLNMSARLAELAEAGVVSFKIEGRMKGEFYLATVVNAYRRILDGGYTPALGAELETVSHRAYTSLAPDPCTPPSEGAGEGVAESQLPGTCDFIAVVRDFCEGRVFAEMRGRFREGETLEILSPGEAFGKSVTVSDLRGEDGFPAPDAKLVQAVYSFPCSFPLSAGDIFRRRKN